MNNTLPTISIIIPTLNSSRTVNECLQSIDIQDYPHELLEIIIADAGSADGTLGIIKAFQNTSNTKTSIYENPLKTGEAGKAVSIKHAKSDLLAFIDSDNILPYSDWLSRMIAPFNNPEIIATEPWEYTYRKEDGYINRYCALMGMNDPLCYFLGNYDRKNVLSGKWTGMELQEEDKGDYLKIWLEQNKLPTIGANGFLIRRSTLLSALACQTSNLPPVSQFPFPDYLFDIDVLAGLLAKENSVHIAKVKTGIIHLYCPDFRTFLRKQKRRILDFNKHSAEGVRKYLWDKQKTKGIFYFLLSCVFVFPLFWQTAKGYSKTFDRCWAFHPVACIGTLWVYGVNSLFARFGYTRELTRETWSQ